MTLSGPTAPAEGGALALICRATDASRVLAAGKQRCNRTKLVAIAGRDVGDRCADTEAGSVQSRGQVEGFLTNSSCGNFLSETKLHAPPRMHRISTRW